MNLIIEVADILMREAFGSVEEATKAGVEGVLLRNPDVVTFANQGYDVHLETFPCMIRSDRLYIHRDDGHYLMITSEKNHLSSYELSYDDICQMFRRAENSITAKYRNEHHVESNPTQKIAEKSYKNIQELELAMNTDQPDEPVVVDETKRISYYRSIVSDYRVKRLTTKEIADNRGLTIRELAEIISSHNCTIAKLESASGRSRRTRLSRLTGVDVLAIYNDIAENPETTYDYFADKYGVTEASISKIALTETHQELLKDKTPLRRRGSKPNTSGAADAVSDRRTGRPRKIASEIAVAVAELLTTTRLSIDKIAADKGVSCSTVRRIMGKTLHPDVTDEYFTEPLKDSDRVACVA